MKQESKVIEEDLTRGKFEILKNTKIKCLYIKHT